MREAAVNLRKAEDARAVAIRIPQLTSKLLQWDESA